MLKANRESAHESACEFVQSEDESSFRVSPIISYKRYKTTNDFY
jgi:hypothetical protein